MHVCEVIFLESCVLYSAAYSVVIMSTFIPINRNLFFEILQIAGIPSVSNPQHFLHNFTFKRKKTLIWKYALVGVFRGGNWA